MGVHYYMYEKHLQGDMNEAVEKHNGRRKLAMSQISGVVQGVLTKRLSYKELMKELPPKSE